MSIEKGPSADSDASRVAMPRVLRRLSSATREPPVLDGFGDVGGADIVAPGQIGDGAGDFEDAVPGTGRQIELRRGLFEQFAAGLVRLAAGVDFLRVEAGVGLGLAGGLPGQGSFDPGAHRRRGLSLGLVGQRVGRQRRYFDDQVDAVEEGAGEFAAIAGNLIRSAAAFVVAVTEKSAGAGIHCRDQLEFGREFGVTGCPRNMDASGFERLAQRFENLAVEFRHFAFCHF